MADRSILNVNRIQKRSNELTYEDLVWLYQDFINRNNRVPTTSEGLSKNNLPQQRIIKKILEDNNVTYNDFINQFGKYSHVRTESKDYDLFVEKFKNVCNQLGYTLKRNDLTNNPYGLPSASWFAKYCPDENVNSYDDFVKWCDFKSNSTTRNKEDVTVALYELQKKLNRPIIYDDITKSNVGFSSIVIDRIWGSLSNCKKELGLLPSKTSTPRPFEYYKNNLDIVLNNYKNENPNCKYIRWSDIENNDIVSVEHKTTTKAFKREGLDVISYIKQQGFEMNPSLFSFHHVYDDGEIAVSSLEYKFSNYLRENGLIYGKDYQRNVMYKTFVKENIKQKINCDYVLWNEIYIEIAGMIDNIDNSWRTYKYKDKKHQAYQKRLLKKETLLRSNNLNYIILFASDIENDTYKTILDKYIRKEENYA